MINVGDTYVNLNNFGDKYGNVPASDRINIALGNGAIYDSAYGKVLYVPRGDWLITTPLIWKVPCRIVTDGTMTATFSVAPYFPATSGVLTINPDLSLIPTGQQFFWGIDGLYIRPLVSIPTLYGFGIALEDSASEFLAKFTMKNCRIGPFTRPFSFDKAGATLNGLFTSDIQYNFFEGRTGNDRVMSMNRSGDSIYVAHNTITGDGIGYWSAPVAGAAQQNLHDNNITAAGGAAYISGGQQVRFYNNQMEQSQAYTGSDDAMIVLDGATDCSIDDNNINAVSRVSAIRFKDATARTRVHGNLISGISSAGGKFHYVFDAAAGTMNDIGLARNTYFTDGVIAQAPRVSNSSTVPQIGVWYDLTAGLQNAWVAAAVGGGFFNGLKAMLDGAKILHLRGHITGGATGAGTLIVQLPVGLRPVTDVVRLTARVWSGAAWLVSDKFSIDTGGNLATTLGGFGSNVLVAFDGTAVELY